MVLQNDDLEAVLEDLTDERALFRRLSGSGWSRRLRGGSNRRGGKDKADTSNDKTSAR